MRPYHKLGVIACLAVAVTLTNSCDGPGERGGSFAGIVVDSATALPIDSAGISMRDTIGEAITYTDSTGHFQQGSFGVIVRIFAQKEGYLTKWKQINLTESPRNIRFELVNVE